MTRKAEIPVRAIPLWDGEIDKLVLYSVKHESVLYNYSSTVQPIIHSIGRSSHHIGYELSW